MTLSYTVSVERFEHSEAQYKGLNPDNYDSGTNNRTVLEGSMFKLSIKPSTTLMS